MKGDKIESQDFMQIGAYAIIILTLSSIAGSPDTRVLIIIFLIILIQYLQGQKKKGKNNE